MCKFLINSGQLYHWGHCPNFNVQKYSKYKMCQLSLIPDLRAHESNEILGNDWIIGRCAVNNSGIIEMMIGPLPLKDV
jgi:hypothetical protein